MLPCDSFGFSQFGTLQAFAHIVAHGAPGFVLFNSEERREVGDIVRRAQLVGGFRTAGKHDATTSTRGCNERFRVREEVPSRRGAAQCVCIANLEEDASRTNTLEHGGPQVEGERSCEDEMNNVTRDCAGCDSEQCFL